MHVRSTVFCLLLINSYVILAQNNHCAEGEMSMIKAHYHEASQHFLSCYQEDTLNKSALKALANSLNLSGDIVAAKRYFHKLENDSLLCGDAISNLAAIYESQQNLPKATHYYTILQRLHPENPLYLRKLGGLYVQNRQTIRALELYTKALQTNSRDIISIQSLSEIYLDTDNLSAADSMVNIGIKIDSAHFGLLLLKSRISYRSKDYTTTSKILSSLDTMMEISNYYIKLLGFSYLQIDSIDRAIYHLQKVLTAEHESEFTLYYLAMAHEKKHEYDRATIYYQDAAKAGLSQNMSQYHQGLARAYAHKKAYSKSLEHYRKSLEFGDNPELYFYMASTAEHLPKHNRKAIRYYQQYIKSGHENEAWRQIANERMKALMALEFMKRK